MEKKSILFIIPWLPYPLSTGGHQALYNGIISIRNDYNVFIIYEQKSGNEEAERHFNKYYPNIVLLPLTYSKPSFFKKVGIWSHILVRKIFREKPSHIELMCARWIKTISPLRKEFVEHVDRICKERTFDIIQVEMPWFISLVLSLPDKAKKVYVHHELGFVCRELEAKPYYGDAYVEACRSFADTNEISLLNMYDQVITLSPVDAEKLRNKGVVKPISSSFAVIHSKVASQINLCDGYQLTFVGPDCHTPNFVGLLWFLENCWGKLKEMDSKYQLNVIGKWSKSNIQMVSSKYTDVHFLGFVDNLEANLQGTIMIVPITIGSGIRMKILEACSMGVPFVSTSVGAEGIPVISGNHCYLADLPDGFVDSIVKLMDQNIQNRFIQNARNLIQDMYSVDSLRENRISIYNRL